jgi:Na+-translocating ferredoxin:NAD+ oxidoreductase RnfA subunit
MAGIREESIFPMSPAFRGAAITLMSASILAMAFSDF